MNELQRKFYLQSHRSKTVLLNVGMELLAKSILRDNVEYLINDMRLDYSNALNNGYTKEAEGYKDAIDKVEEWLLKIK